jgi:ParB family transcriptional regulator, chromosome partitioning protein
VPPRRAKGFFQEPARAEDVAARQREVEALLAPRRTLVQDLPAERIRPNPFQARATFAGLEELRDAILAHGFTSRLRVRPDPLDPGFFQLVYGERRLRAARLAGLELIPCEIAEHSDDELLEIGLAENIQRQDLHPLEEARALDACIRERGYSLRRLAERIGKDKGYLENRLALLQLPPDVQALVARRPDTLRAAREIAKIAEPAQRAHLIDRLVAGEIATAEVRDTVRDLASPSSDGQGGVAQQPTPPTGAGERPAVAGLLGAAAPTAEQGRVEREAATVRRILARWEQLVAQDPTARVAIGAAIGALIDVVERVAETLREPGGEPERPDEL